jgi:hypothetical protein
LQLLASTIVGCEGATALAASTTATGVAARLRFAFLVLIDLFGTDFTDSFALSALAVGALGTQAPALPAAKLLK